MGYIRFSSTARLHHAVLPLRYLFVSGYNIKYKQDRVHISGSSARRNSVWEPNSLCFLPRASIPTMDRPTRLWSLRLRSLRPCTDLPGSHSVRNATSDLRHGGHAAHADGVSLDPNETTHAVTQRATLCLPDCLDYQPAMPPPPQRPGHTAHAVRSASTPSLDRRRG